MPGMHLNFDGDHAGWAKRHGYGRLPVVHTTEDWAIDCLKGGMQSGRTSLMVMVKAKLKTHQAVHLMLETSVQSWMQVAVILKEKFKDEVDDPGWAILPPAVQDMLRPRWAEALRRILPDITAEQAEEAAQMFLDGLAAGSPED